MDDASMWVSSFAQGGEGWQPLLAMAACAALVAERAGSGRPPPQVRMPGVEQGREHGVGVLLVGQVPQAR